MRRRRRGVVVTDGSALIAQGATRPQSQLKPGRHNLGVASFPSYMPDTLPILLRPLATCSDRVFPFVAIVHYDGATAAIATQRR